MLGQGAGEGGSAEFTEPASCRVLSEHTERSSLTSGQGGCGAVGVLEGVSALTWPSGDWGDGWCPQQRQGTGEAQAWGHLAQRRVGVTLSEDEDMKPACVRSGKSPAPLPAKLPEHLHGGLSHTGS